MSGPAGRRPRGVVALVALAALVAVLVLALGAPGAFAGTQPLASPHLPGDDTTDQCARCHELHSAGTRGSILKAADAAGGDVSMCAECHKASAMDLLGLRGGRGTGSGHPLELLSEVTTSQLESTTPPSPVSVQRCSACHDPHAGTRAGLTPKWINGARVTGADNTWCLACHDDAASWYREVSRTAPYPATDRPLVDAEGYPVYGTFPGRSVYASASLSAHARIPAVGGTAPRVAGSCLNCHAAHVSRAEHDGLTGGFAAPTASTVGQDRTKGGYAALCFACHDGSRAADGAADIARYALRDGNNPTVTSGHRVVTAGGTLPAGAPLPCYECHNPHGSAGGNASLIADTRGAGMGTDSAEGTRRFCLSCHATAEGKVTAGTGLRDAVAGDLVVGLRRDGRAGAGRNKLRLSAVDGHRAADARSCGACHGASYASATSSNVHAPAPGTVAPAASQMPAGPVPGPTPDAPATTQP